VDDEEDAAEEAESDLDAEELVVPDLDALVVADLDAD
jgi:hypothetical protein